MYVCLCKGVTDHQIRDAVANGNTTLADVSQQLGVATQCRRCTSLAQDIITESLHDEGLDYSPLFYAAS